jgi:endonuclease/exonuclease/phosphatase family metal-dependent hydrolase
VAVAVPAREGILAYSRVLAPYLALLFVPLGLLALWQRGRARWLLGAIVLVGLGLAVVRFAPVLPIGRADVDASALRLAIASWNVAVDEVEPDVLLEALAERAPAVIGLQELGPGLASVIDAAPVITERYPYRVLEPASDWTGMGLLSTWPVEGDVETSVRPPLIAATVVPPDGEPLDVIVAHAPPPTMGILRTGPRFDPTNRDIGLRRLQERIDASIEAGRDVVLVGDLNLTDRELGYADLADGLADSYRVAGSGWGHTWRPPSVAGLPFGLLRLDMACSGPGLTPVASDPDCTPRRTDHCLLDVAYVREE